MGKMPFLLCSLPILGMGAVEQWDGVNTLHWSERRAVGHCPIVTTIAPWSRGLEGCGPLETLFTRPSVMTQRIHRALITQDRVIIKQDRTGSLYNHH